MRICQQNTHYVTCGNTFSVLLMTMMMKEIADISSFSNTRFFKQQQTLKVFCFVFLFQTKLYTINDDNKMVEGNRQYSHHISDEKRMRRFCFFFPNSDENGK